MVSGQKHEKAELLAKEPQAEKFIKRLLGSLEFINGIDRWRLWLKDVAPSDLRSMPGVMSRIEKVRQHRLASNRAATVKAATFPYLFNEIKQPNSNYLLDII